MSTDERRAYLLTALRKAPEGSARRIWAQSMLAQLDRPTQAPKATPTRKETKS